MLISKENIQSYPRLLNTMKKYFIRLGWPWYITKLNSRQGPVLLCQWDHAYSGRFPSGIDQLLSTHQWTAHLCWVNSVLSFSSVSYRHPQGATTWALRSGLCPSSAWERKCSTAGATPESSCLCNTQAEGPPLSGHLLVQCWGNLHGRPPFWPAGIQPYRSEFIQKLAKPRVRSDVGSMREVVGPKERWMGIEKIKLYFIREHPIMKPDIFNEKRTSLAKLCVNGQ